MNKKKLTTICIILIFLLIIPNVNAISINKTTNENNQNPKPIGKIHGQVVHYPYEIMGYALGFAIVKIEDKSDISSPILGYYSISGLETDKEYIIEYSHRNYITKYRDVYLSSEHPVRELELQFYQNEKKTRNINKQNVNDEIDNNKESSDMGLIYGEVGNSHGVYTWTFYPFALVTSGLKRSRCNFFGQYSMKLSLNKEHFVTAHVTGFKPLTKKIFLTDEKPTKEIFFDMDESSPLERSKETKTHEDNCYGSVYGLVRYSPDGYYGDMPAYYTLVKIENKFDLVSFIDGSYKIRGLELGKTYTVEFSNRRFKTKTETVTLTAEKPNVELDCFFYSEDERDLHDRRIKSKNIENSPIKDSLLFKMLFTYPLFF